ncbi:MAG: CDP-alcohol phosphatidyltransferase family protein [Kineosporiaceae bacterium]
MLDAALRPHKDAALALALRGPVLRLDPLVLTAAGLAVGLGGAVAAWRGAFALALVLWLLNRLLDGLDGALARTTGRHSDLGAYLDIVADHAVAAALTLGIAASVGSPGAYLVAAVLLSTYYVNAATWMYLSALLERRRAGAAATGERTAVTMPGGLVEGAETIAFYVLVLALPGLAVPLFWAMAALVLLTAGQRVAGARRLLTPDRRADTPEGAAGAPARAPDREEPSRA